MVLAYRNSGAWGAGNGGGAGGRLTSTQADNNIWELASSIADLVAAGTAIGIDPDNPVTISGDQLTFYFSDSSIKTITVPTGMPVWRGEYGAVSYAAGDWFSSNGIIYRVLTAHTGSLPFDPGASTTASGDYYQLVMNFVSNPGKEVSDRTYTLQLSDANYFIVLTNVNGCTVTIDPAVEFPAWTEIHFRDETEAGVNFEVVTGASISSQYLCLDASAGQGSTITLKKGSADTWYIFGLLASAVTA